MPRLIHLLTKHWGDGHPTGVPRFSRYFQQAFPEVMNYSAEQVGKPEWEWNDGDQMDIVVTDNHLSLLVPEGVRTIVVHHGCAPYHYDVDPTWRNDNTKRIAEQQIEMFRRKYRAFVAPSQWVGMQFTEYAKRNGIIFPPPCAVIPHWVPLNNQGPRIWKPERVIGDWRNWNKGAELIPQLRAAMPDIEFVQLNFDAADDAARQDFYRRAGVYLCLSLSEGGPYSVADAEAAELPIVTTETGYVFDFPEAALWRVKDRNNLQAVVKGIRLALQHGRGGARSFYERDCTFERWKAAWQHVINTVSQ